MGTFHRNWSAPVDDDHALRSVINEVYRSYGDHISFEEKGKSLIKFGRTRSASAAEKQEVTIFQDTGINEELYATTNSVDSFVGSDTGDLGTVFRIEGHYLDTGLNDLTFSVQDVTSNGTTPVTLGTALARATRIYIPGTGAAPLRPRDATGRIHVYDSTVAGGVTNGVPNDGLATKLVLEGNLGKNQGEKCATTISATDYWAIHEINVTVSRGGPQDPVVDCDVEVRTMDGVWRPLGLELTLDASVESHIHDTMLPRLIVPKNSDVRLVGTSSLASTFLSGYMAGRLAKIVD